MDDDIYVRTLTKNRVYIRDNVVDVQGILDHLLVHEIVRNEQSESILAERTPTERKRRLMDILVKCAPKKQMFETFCLALQQEGFTDAKDTLEKDFNKLKQEKSRDSSTHPAAGAGGGDRQQRQGLPIQVQADGPEWLSPDQRSRLVGEREVALISKHIGELDYLGLALGFTRGRIDQFKMYAPYNPSLQVLKMLFEWRSKEGPKATVGEFVAKLREGGVDESVMEEVFGTKSS